MNSKAEEHVALAIERLREDMPTSFIIVYEHNDGGIQTLVYANLSSVQRLLLCAIEAISEEYAVKVALSVGDDGKGVQ